MRKFHALLILFAGLVSGSMAGATLSDTITTAEPTDTTDRKVTRLEEVVVTGETQWRDGDKYVFLPQKRQKNIASDANSLLNRMSLPVLQYGKPNEAPKGLDGKPIVIYINGIKATDLDLSTFWPKQCIRVEFYEEPQDPRFNGDHNVVNFIMPVYEWGGLTRIRGSETMPGSSGDYSLSSKFTYKDMVYGVYLGGGYSRDHFGGKEATTEYRDLYYDGLHYDLITGEEKSASVSRSDNVAGSFSARYVKGNTNINHQISLNWNRNPDSYSRGLLTYTPNILDGNDMISRSRSRSLSPVVSAQYEFRPREVNFAVNWKYSHNHNNSWSEYAAGADEPFFNSTRENVNSLSGTLFAGWTFKNKKGALTGFLSTNYDWYGTLYGGTYDNDIRQRRGTTTLRANVQYKPTENSRITLSPQLALSYWTLEGDENNTKLSPGAEASYFVNWSTKNTTSLMVSYFRHDPGASQWNDAMVRQSELWWVKGNPSVDIYDTWWIHLSHYLNLCKPLTLSISGWWTRDVNSTALRYYAATPEQGGLVKEYFNTAGRQSASFFLDPRLRLFDGNLSVWTQIQGSYYMNFGRDGADLFAMHYSGGVNYYFGNFSAGFYFNTKQKWIDVDNTFGSYPLQTGLSLSYGNGNFQAYVSVSNFTNARFTSVNRQSTPVYYYSDRTWNRGCNFYISASYTFDYGKKISDRSTIDAESDSKTSVVGK